MVAVTTGWRFIIVELAMRAKTDSVKEEKEDKLVDHADLQENIIGSADKFDLDVCTENTNKNELGCVHRSKVNLRS